MAKNPSGIIKQLGWGSSQANRYTHRGTVIVDLFARIGDFIPETSLTSL